MTQPFLSRSFFLRSSALLFGVAIALAGVAFDGARLQARQAARQADANTIVNPALFQGLRYRLVGPHRGGRVTAVAGHRRQPSTFYMGATGGGVWKTTDYGITWVNISDGYFSTGSIGAIAVAESEPNVVYVGTGSAAIRSNVIKGRGVYKSTDAGRTWTFVGLENAGQISRIRIHPQDPNLAYVASIGQAFGPNPDRGVFRTRDGGKTWQKVFHVNDRIGAYALAMNPSNPSEIYASAWRAERKPWTIISGGPAKAGGGIYKTTNGGDTWTKLEKGLPQGLIGKIDLDVAASDPSRLYALVEAPGNERGVYRSDDGGASWAQTNSELDLTRRPFYYTYINVHPKNPEHVWVNNEGFYKSEDGGKTFRRGTTPHGDNHGMWINPDNPDIFIQSNDGGANVTQNGGRSWSTQYNQPTSEIYQVAVDSRFPYRLYGAQQDNSTLIVPSLPPLAHGMDDPIQLWMPGPGCETGPVLPHPTDPDIVYGACKGEFYRLNLRTGQIASYWVHPQNRYSHNPKDTKFRFQRVSPMEIDPHDPKVVYHASHVVHRSTDEGVTWTVASPDLTAFEPDKQVISGEPITRDITGEEVYSTLYALRESALEHGVLWAGANDGPVHVSRDNGKTWQKVTPKDLPPGGRVQNIEPSSHRKGSAYVAIYRYLLNDWQPYIYRTDDYGATWKRLTDGTNGIPADYPTRVVREDPDREGLLYAGTEFGLFISFDNGAHWQSFQLNLPATPVTDIRVHQQDLAISTMGRAFWVLDNVTPLHQIALGRGRPTEAGGTGRNGNGGSNGDGAGLQARGGQAGLSADGSAAAHLFEPRAAYRMRYSPMSGQPGEPQYPPVGAQIDYYFATEPAGEVKLEILDRSGNVIRSISSEAPPGATAQMQEMRGPFRGGGGPARLPKGAGHNRFVWDLRHGGPWDANPQRSGTGGPLAVPGAYQVRLTAGSWSQTRPLEVKIDPRLPKDGVTQADLEEQLDLNLKLRDTTSEARLTAAEIAQARQQLQKHGGAEATLKKLQELEAKLATAGGSYPQPMLIDQLGNISRMVNGADRKVGRSTFEYHEELKKELAAIQAELKKVLQ